MNEKMVGFVVIPLLIFWFLLPSLMIYFIHSFVERGLISNIVGISLGVTYFVVWGLYTIPRVFTMRGLSI
jgi:predicted permease